WHFSGACPWPAPFWPASAGPAITISSATGRWSGSGRRRDRWLLSSWSAPARSSSPRPCFASARCRTSRWPCSGGCAARFDRTEGADMRPYLPALGALLLLGTCAEAPAQTYVERYYVPDQHVHWHIDTGYAPTTGSISSLLNGGWTVGGGFSWQPDFSSPLALRTDLNYSRFNATRQLIGINEEADQTEIDDGYGEIVDLAVDGEYRMPLSPYLTGFALAGVGVAHRRIALTQTAAVGGYVCDYWFGYCDFGL